MTSRMITIRYRKIGDKLKKAALLIYIIIAFSAVTSSAKEINFELKLQKDRVYPGRQTQLEIIFPSISDIPAPEMPFIDGLDIKYVKSVKAPSGTEKSLEGSVIYIYRVTALRAGVFKIGPVAFEYGGKTYISSPVYLTSAKETAGAGKTAALAERSELDITKHIYLVLDIPKKNIFLNEKLPVTLKLYSDWIDLEDIILSQESSKTLIMDKFDKADAGTVIIDGVKYAVLEYRSSLFAVTPGLHRLEPVTVSLKVVRAKSAQAKPLNDNMQIYDRFIGDSESRALELRTKQADITAMPLPPEGQPEDFNGAVGSFNFNIDAGPVKIRPGGTVTVKMVISGPGNYNTLSPPGVKQIDGIKVYDPRAVKSADSATYEQAVRIDSADVKEIPAVTFSFFDPEKSKYMSLKRGPITIEVEGGAVRAPGKKAAVIKAGAAATDLTGLIVAMKDSPGNLKKQDMLFYKKNIFILLWILPLMAMFSAAVIKKRLEFLRGNPGYAAMLRASKKARRGIIKVEAFIKSGDPKAFYENTFRVMQNYLGERLLVPEAGITEKTTEALSAAGVEDDMLIRIKKLFSDCYLARYARLNFNKPDMNVTLEELRYVIENMDRKSFRT